MAEGFVNIAETAKIRLISMRYGMLQKQRI